MDRQASRQTDTVTGTGPPQTSSGETFNTIFAVIVIRSTEKLTSEHLGRTIVEQSISNGCSSPGPGSFSTCNMHIFAYINKIGKVRFCFLYFYFFRLGH